MTKLAEAQGLTGIGPVIDCAGLGEALVPAVALVKDGGGVVVDVRVTPQIAATAASRSGERK